ncbi:maltokinase N-terminal cap-like domain-containing protein [Auraticoccus monumenti]|uniref:Maltokinase N-terminal cap domain-containing protein n=1 Tax=Auraticoccus monumenti TaxID=675864 RepID=A0A1G7CY50_9ACTN|nr:hypothetical protein [Auraticoccus monumenti]SDE44238.1 hypothetical protein SAMN04489747_3419 [Auraticoccus monumenti]
MAIIHPATIAPTKQELLATELGGPVEVVGSYRFDDPAGEVGVEGFLVRRDGALRHVLLTYRAAPAEGEGARLVCTMEHSVLGRRWVHDGATDPVALGCLGRAVLGQQEQAVLEIWSDGERVGTREPTLKLSVEPGTDADTGDTTVWINPEPGPSAGTGPVLLASWAGGGPVVLAGLAPTEVG